MGCVSSKTTEQSASTECRCCILGIAGSGKSTYVKQLRMLHNQEWSSIELDDIATMIQLYLLQRMKEILDHIKIMSLELEGPNLKHSRTIYLQLWDERSHHVLGELWKDPAVSKSLQSISGEARFQMLPYFMGRLDVLAQPNYRPTTEDILRTRMRTSTVSLTSVFADKLMWNFIDCGGQKNERAKWPKILSSESFDVILYCVAVDEYNTPSTEDPSKTNLQVSLLALSSLFGWTPQAPRMPIIFLLNKIDAFTPKFDHNPSTFKKPSQSLKERQVRMH